MNLSIKWDVNSLTLYFISTFPRWVRLRVKSKMMESSLRATSSNRKIIESLGILGCLMVNHLLWGHDLIKTNDSYNKSLFSVDGGFKWKEQLLISSGCSTDLKEIWQGIRTCLAVTLHQMGWCWLCSIFANQKKTNAPFSFKISWQL